MPENNQTTGYDRYLSRIDAWGMALGCMVGWGAFVMPGTTFLPVAGPLGTIIAMVIGVIVMLVIASSVSFLMRRSTGTGGLYSYTKEAFGRDHAFLCSWFLCLSYLTIVFLNGTALFLVIRTLFGSGVQTGIHYTIAGNQVYLGEAITSVLALAVIGVLFLVAKAALQKIHTILAILLFACAVIAAIFCIPHALSGNILSSFGTQGVNPVHGIFSLVLLAPWAFVGFEVLTFDTAHFKFPFKKTTGIIVSTLLIAAFIYLAMTLISVSSIPDGFASWGEYINSLDSQTGLASVPTFYAAKSIMGTAGLVVMAVAAMAAILTGIIGAYRATMRVLSTMAEDSILSEKFKKTSVSILFVMALSILISLLGRNTLIWFVDLTSFGAIVAYGYTSAAAYKIAKTENNKKIRVTSMIGLIITGIFAIVQLVPKLAALEAMDSAAFLLLSLWCLLGFVFYWKTIQRSNLTEYSGMSTSGIVLFALLVYAAMMWLAKVLFAQSETKAVRTTIIWGGILLAVIVFVGLAIMLYIQNLVRKKHEASEREKIRAVEGSLAKSQFLFNMSHDIRTPMNAIIGYTNLAMDEEASPQIHNYLTKINASSQHLLELINDILEMSRIESGKIELDYVPNDITSVLTEMQDLFAEQMKHKEIDFQVHTSQVRDKYVWCDKKYLNRILLNLLSNALKFTPEGGVVRTSLWETGASEGEYRSYEFRVKDNGIGMSKEFVEKMFTAFERERTSTDSGIEGTGLGLAITKSIVDLMGGTIDVLTSPGNGTEIIIHLTFRLADPEVIREKQAAEEKAANEEVDFSKTRLLLVEDNAINMEIAQMILTQKGFMVETAENGQIAVDMVTSSAPDHFDAILMDIQMPVMDGYTATKTIRALDDPLRSKIPILAMTANAFKEDEEAAIEAGMQAHIAKPIDVDSLISKLKVVLHDASEQSEKTRN